jgi:Ion channel
VTFDRILGAIALYVLIGVVWAEAYQLVSIRVPDAYAGIAGGSGSPDRASWIYFSFVTLTTVGYGDITPVAHAARSLAILEALIGQLYPAIVLARLVSLHVAGGSGTNEA